jgi:hypothetical protein
VCLCVCVFESYSHILHIAEVAFAEFKSKEMVLNVRKSIFPGLVPVSYTHVHLWS